MWPPSAGGTHPQVIRPWLAEHANPRLEFDPDYRITRRERKHRMLRPLEKVLSRDFSKRHFKVIASFR